jgi:hypothetical protein
LTHVFSHVFIDEYISNVIQDLHSFNELLLQGVSSGRGQAISS